MDTDTEVAILVWRETRRSGLIVLAALVGLIVAFGSAYSAATFSVSPGSSGSFTSLTDNPAVRALYGVPYAIDTRGGFVVWRCTLMIPLLVTLWTAMSTTRVLRGEEDAGRWDLLLAEPLRRTRSTGVHLAVVTLWCVAIGSAVAIAFAAGDNPAAGSILYGAGIGLLALTFGAVAACAAQLFGNRRVATGVTGALIGGAMVVRMAADGSTGREWLRWLTPFGWVENLKPFAGDEVLPLVPLLLAPCVLVAVTLVLVHGRDLGEGFIRVSDSSDPKTLLLRSPVRFAWRQRRGGLMGWSAGMVFYGVVIGAITASGVTFIAANPDIEHAVAQLGMTGLSTPEGFVAACTPLVAVALAFYGASSLGHCFEDEERARLDLPYSEPVTRTTWLGSQVGAATVAVCVALVVSIVATWIGCLAGDAGLGMHDLVVATLNVLPVTVLFVGLAILLFGLRPQLAVSVAAGGAIAAYALSLLGPALDWPNWVNDLNPFLQLGNAPVVPVDWIAVVVILAIGALAASVGFVTYAHRDLA